MKIVLKKTDRGLRAYIDGKKKTTPFVSSADFAEWVGTMQHFNLLPKDAKVLYHNGLCELVVTPTYENPVKSRPRILI